MTNNKKDNSTDDLVREESLTRFERIKARIIGLPSRSKDSFKHYKLNDWLIFFLCIFLTCCYVGVLIYGVLQKQEWQRGSLENDNISTVSLAQAQLIINSAAFGILASWLPYTLKWVLKLKISFSLNLIIQIYCAAGMIVGEALQVYYLIPTWDVILHVFSGLFFTILGYILFRIFTRHNKIKHKVLLGVMFGIFCSLAVSVIWEVYEFTCDSIGGLNMQKILPEDVDWFNGGNTKEILDQTYWEEILEFYSSPTGYRYALMDTMEDFIGCCIGTGVTAVFIAVVAHFNPDAFEDSIKLVRRNKEDITYKKDRYVEDDDTVDDSDEVEEAISRV